MKKNILTGFIAAACSAVFILSAAGCSGTVPAETPEPTPIPTLIATPVPTPTPTPTPTPEPTPIPTLEPTPEPTPEPAASAAPDETPAPVETQLPEETKKPVPEEPKAPERGLSAAEPVDDTFFDDAAFFGNSLVDGLRIYGGLKHGSFFAATSASVVNVEKTLNYPLEDGEKCTLFDALTKQRYGKIYILLGINEISFEPDYFVSLYEGLIERIRECEPDAEIYVMSLTPLTRDKTRDESMFTNGRVMSYNDAIYDMCTANGYNYIDLFYALSDENGYLPEEESTDGVHLVRAKYVEWADCLRTHYAQ